jgi:uncharacterized membrane protein
VSYLTLKTLHVLFVALFLGAGIASVFYKLMADRTGDTAVIAATMKHLVLADAVFTIPSVIGLPVTGLAMLGGSVSLPWIKSALVLYVLAGIPWLIAVKLQFDMRRLACAAHTEQTPLDPSYTLKTRVWLALGFPSFGFSLLLIFLMVNKRLPWQ